ncbi:MAG: hypothetical protein RL197_64 [Actinomycetota bacterium]|jgi:hypothetical protein
MNLAKVVKRQLLELLKIYLLSVVVAGAVLSSSLVYQGATVNTIASIFGALPFAIFVMSAAHPGSLLWILWLFFVQFRYVQKAVGAKRTRHNLVSRIIENPWIAIFVGMTFIALPFFVTGSIQFIAPITASMYISLVCILYILVNAAWNFVSRRLQHRNVAETKP